MRKNQPWIIGFLLSTAVILIVLNFRYPFLIQKNGNWSVGFQKIKSPIEKIHPHSNQILTFESHNLNTEKKVKFLADPFFISFNNLHYIFFEEQAEGNANIAYYVSRDRKNYKYGGVVLDEDFHLSFPQVFRYKDEMFLLPEARGSKHLILYKATIFPKEWEIADTLIYNFNLKDPAILLSDDFNIITASDDNLKQYVFKADSLRDKWIKADEFESRIGDETRAGGNFFQYEGEWYVPFQNNSRGYGTGLSLYRLNYIPNKFLKFKREVDFQLYPQNKIEWFNRGMHHLNITKNGDKYFAVYDGDRKTGKYKWAWKASLKYNYYDLIRFFQSI